MECPNCHNTISNDWISCPYCDYHPKKCTNPSCKPLWLPLDALFCPQCGKPMGAAKSLLPYAVREGRFSIDKDKCIGCGKCAASCPDEKIHRMDYKAPGHKLGSFEMGQCCNIKCTACVDNCRFGGAIVTQEYWYRQNGFNVINESARISIYEHYLTGGMFTFVFPFIFTSNVVKCVEEIHSLYLFMGYRHFDKPHEDALLSEWMIKNERILNFLKKRSVWNPLHNLFSMNEDDVISTERLTKYVCDVRTKAGLK